MRVEADALRAVKETIMVQVSFMHAEQKLSPGMVHTPSFEAIPLLSGDAVKNALPEQIAIKLRDRLRGKLS